MYQDPNRNTGRTSRMLGEAILQATQGATCFVVGINYQHIQGHLSPMLRQILCEFFPGIKVTEPHRIMVSFGDGKIVFVSSQDEDCFCWKTKSVKAADGIEVCRVFIDHSVPYFKDKDALAIFHAFDAPPPPKIDTRKDELVAEVNRLRALLATALFDLNKTSGSITDVIDLISREEL